MKDRDKKTKIKYIAIAGNIGSGKTTLTHLLAKHLKAKAYLEDISNNPYIHDFYMDMNRWAFPLQIYFLQERFRQNQIIQKEDKLVVQDRTIYEDVYVFSRVLYEKGCITEKDYKTYTLLYESIAPFIKPPDLLLSLIHI